MIHTREKFSQWISTGSALDQHWITTGSLDHTRSLDHGSVVVLLSIYSTFAPRTNPGELIHSANRYALDARDTDVQEVHKGYAKDVCTQRMCVKQTVMNRSHRIWFYNGFTVFSSIHCALVLRGSRGSVPPLRRERPRLSLCNSCFETR